MSHLFKNLSDFTDEHILNFAVLYGEGTHNTGRDEPILFSPSWRWAIFATDSSWQTKEIKENDVHLMTELIKYLPADTVKYIFYPRQQGYPYRFEIPLDKITISQRKKAMEILRKFF